MEKQLSHKIIESRIKWIPVDTVSQIKYNNKNKHFQIWDVRLGCEALVQKLHREAGGMP